MLSIVLTPYRWRDRDYKDIRNLMKAVDKAHGGSTAISFGIVAMYVRDLDTKETVAYGVTRGDVNIITADPDPNARTRDAAERTARMAAEAHQDAGVSEAHRRARDEH